jgi:hypothetical protein
MSEEKTIKNTFEPITSQQQLDEIVERRLGRAKEKWEKESDSDALRAQVEAKDRELDRRRREYALDLALRDAGLTGPVGAAKAQRIKNMVDLDAETLPEEQLAALQKDVPELFQVPRGAGSGGSSKAVVEPSEQPITRQELEGMSESEINSRWDAIKRFMAGER